MFKDTICVTCDVMFCDIHLYARSCVRSCTSSWDAFIGTVDSELCIACSPFLCCVACLKKASISLWTNQIKRKLQFLCGIQKLLTLKWPRGFLGTQDLFFAHFTTFASAFFTVIFSNCLTIGYASFDAKKN